MAEKCFKHAMDLSGLLPLCFSFGYTEGVLKLATLATARDFNYKVNPKAAHSLTDSEEYPSLKIGMMHLLLNLKMQKQD
ncbi:unnamed protein product [Lathyrus oleraceus]